ncbi:MAG TPA: nucleoside phosphorylase [Bacteroidia bacterium]|nr:nucleoside phosphorylase [Bacteroidia bacterium]
MRSHTKSELILNAQNKVYHLDLSGEQIADTVFLVGDPNRVQKVTAHFSSIEFMHSHREFVSATGMFNGKRLTVLSTGIGPDNIDIVVNELDAAVNIDPINRTESVLKRSLNLIRLGTSGSLQEDIPINSIVASAYGLGIDGLLNFYKKSEVHSETDLEEDFIRKNEWPSRLARPYAYKANDFLINQASEKFIKGITVTAPGFYAPQGRELRLETSLTGLNEKLSAFRHKGYKITNFEMECSALYGLGKLLGHRCLTLCVIIANRKRGEFSTNLEQSEKQLIEAGLNQFYTV